MSISTILRKRPFGKSEILASDAEMRHLRTAVRAAAAYETKYGRFQTIIDCEDVIAEAMHESMGDTGDYDMVDGDVFYELLSHVTMAYYGGEFTRG